VIPGLPRSGEWERPPSRALGVEPGKRRPVGPGGQSAVPGRPRVRRPAGDVRADPMSARVVPGLEGGPADERQAVRFRAACSDACRIAMPETGS
jgi:hypothetical protein